MSAPATRCRRRPHRTSRSSRRRPPSRASQLPRHGDRVGLDRGGGRHRRRYHLPGPGQRLQRRARAREPYTVIVRVDDQPTLPPCAREPVRRAQRRRRRRRCPRRSIRRVNTLFLVDRARMVTAYGAAGASAILARLDDPRWLAAGVRGAVLPVDGSPTVATAFDAWDAKPCDVDRSNDVVQRDRRCHRRLQGRQPRTSRTSRTSSSSATARSSRTPPSPTAPPTPPNATS